MQYQEDRQQALNTRASRVREAVLAAREQFQSKDPLNGGFARLPKTSGVLRPVDTAFLLRAFEQIDFSRTEGAIAGRPTKIAFDSLPDHIQDVILQVVTSEGAGIQTAAKFICGDGDSELELVPRWAMRYTQGQGFGKHYDGSRYPATQASLIIQLGSDYQDGEVITYGPVVPSFAGPKGHGYRPENKCDRGQSKRGDITLIRRDIWHEVKPLKAGARDVIAFEVRTKKGAQLSEV